MLNTNVTTKVTKRQPVVWMLDYSGELENEVRTGERSADGKFLKIHVPLETPVKVHSQADVAMAERFGCDVDMLFA